VAWSIPSEKRRIRPRFCLLWDVSEIFSARAVEPESIPIIQAWAEKHGLGRLEVTNQKDYDLIRFYDDRAIQMLPNQGKTVSCLVNGKPD